MGIPWQQAMGGVFIASILFTLVSFFKLREIIIDAIPQDLKYAMAAGIGIFISFVGLEGGGIVIADPSSLVAIGSFKVPTTWLTIFGVFITSMLMAKKVPGSIFYGIVLTAIMGLVTQIIPPPERIISMAPSLAPTFGVGVVHTAEILTDPQMWAVVIIFFLVAFFDTAGTLVAIGNRIGLINDKGELENAEQALVADAFGTVFGAVLGTSTVTSFVESSSGVGVGGRTGLTACTSGVCFLLAVFLSPLILSTVTNAVTAPALIVVGIMMAQQLKGIDWDDMIFAAAGFVTVIMMILMYSISNGIACGFIVYTVAMIAAGKAKEVHPTVWVLMVIFVLYFATPYIM